MNRDLWKYKGKYYEPRCECTGHTWNNGKNVECWSGKGVEVPDSFHKGRCPKCGLNPWIDIREPVPDTKKWLAVICVDTNDADYNRGFFVVDDEEKRRIELLFQVVKQMPIVSRGSIPIKMYEGMTNEIVDDIMGMCPSGEYGFHTIEDITFYPLAGEAECLNINLEFDATF